MRAVRGVLAVLCFLLTSHGAAHADYEIYSGDMQSSYEQAESTNAPCSNGGYFSWPPRFDIGSCMACQASIKKARGEIEDYGSLCSHTHDVEAQTAASNTASVSATWSAQNSALQNGGNVQSAGSSGEYLKQKDAGTLRDQAKACQSDVACDGNIAPEDYAAGKAEKSACSSLQNGSNQVYNEKGGNSSTMTGLDGTDVVHDSGLGGYGTSGGLIANPIPAMQAAAAALSAGAAGAGLASSGHGGGSGLTISNIMASSNGDFGPQFSQSYGGAAFGSAYDSSVALKPGGGTLTAALSWSDYMSYMKSNAAGAGAAGGAAASAADKGDPSAGDVAEAPTGGHRMAPKAGEAPDASGEPAPAAPGIITGKAHVYSDPWMDYVSDDGSRQLVDRLRENPQLRKKIRDKIAELIEEEDAQPGASTTRKERLEYYRTALAEAEKQLRQGSFKALAPLETKEMFSMDDGETNREVQRMLASMGSGTESDDSPYSLFPRVHRALWRQVGAGKLRLYQAAH